MGETVETITLNLEQGGWKRSVTGFRRRSGLEPDNRSCSITRVSWVTGGTVGSKNCVQSGTQGSEVGQREEEPGLEPEEER